MFSKSTDHYTTPQSIYSQLHKEFRFTYDPCPLHSVVDTLVISKKWGIRVFVNPPYSNITGFLEKARQEMQKGHTELAVFLVPARTDTKWFHEYVLNKATIRFIKGRLKFGDSKNSAPFPSMVLVYKKEVLI